MTSLKATSSLSIVYFDSELIRKCISRLKVKSSAGPDNLPPIMFKQLTHQLCEPLAIMFRLLMQFGEVPDGWKQANVTPIFKKGSSSDPQNYRPISLTCISCKLFESGIKLHLVQYLEDHDILSHCQHGFLSKHSACTNLLECLNDWTEGLDMKSDTFVAYIDFAKAFDRVSIPKLLLKLSHIGITGKLLSCIKSFLTHRSQRVRIDGTLSGCRSVISGVPQGSVLGPILFLIYINDITNDIPSQAIVKLFADDLKSYVRIEHDGDEQYFVATLEKLSNWADKWQLPLATAKCCWIEITNKQEVVQCPFTLNDADLTKVNEIKDLGVLFNSNLNFSYHISGIISKAKQRLFLLQKCFVSSSSNALILAYTIYVLPLLEYCSQVWSPQHVTEINRVESVQRTFTKRLKDFQGLSYSERLTKAQLCTLELRRLRADLLLCYKILHKAVVIHTTDCFFELDVNSRTRGNSWKLKLSAARLNSRLQFYTHRTGKVWNSLSDNTVNSESILSFKKNLKSEDLSKFLLFNV
jgi:hypothetical protein